MTDCSKYPSLLTSHAKLMHTNSFANSGLSFRIAPLCVHTNCGAWKHARDACTMSHHTGLEAKAGRLPHMSSSI